MNKTKLDAANFNQLLAEIKGKYPFVRDIYYSEHIGNWTIKYPAGNEDEFESFDQLYSELDQMNVNYKDYLETLEVKPSPGQMISTWSAYMLSRNFRS